MTITIFGFIIAALGLLLLLRGGMMDMFLLMMACSLLGGSAAMLLPALGGSSIPPTQFALLFCIARAALPGSGQLRNIPPALKANIFLFAYTGYGIVAAAFAPRYFQGQIWVPAMRVTAKARSLFDTVPLAPSSQNITVSAYMTGTFLAGVAAFVAMQDRNAARRFVQMGIIIAWIHMALGVLAALLKGTPFDLVIDFMRNANYTQTNQEVFGIVRLTGIFTEPSSYAGFGFGWFVFLFECWLRNVMPRRTGPAAAAMGAVLFCSTSSTAYVALAGYGFLFGLRTLVLPQYLGATKGLAIAMGVLLVLIAASAAALLLPAMLDLITTILESATVGKQDSESAMQRAFWAKSGWDAFVASRGVGIGPGSFRSSSFVTAMLGSVGLIGSLALICHILRAIKPLRLSTYCGPREARRFGEETMIGVAAGWAALGVLIPASIASPSCDPGFDFAIFTGVALALRMSPSRVRRPDNDEQDLGRWSPGNAYPGSGI
jgi:hypothetical protein